jgi:Fur family ferric uptake transcriptional regulator
MTSVRREKAAGLRSTRQRASIVSALRTASGFKTAQELHRDLLRRGERVGLATVYRNLQALTETEEVDAIQTGVGETMYRLCEEGDHHHHLVCRRCGLSVEVVAEEVEAWAHRVGKRHGFENVTHTAEIFGLCSNCSP